MIKKSSRQKYRRLLLFYSLVIIIPGTFLGILAYRGIQNNRIAEVKIRNDRLVRKSRYFTGSVNETINNYLDDYSKILITEKNHFLSLEPAARADTLIENGVVMNAAVWVPGGLIKFLDQTTFFVPEDFWNRSGPLDNNLKNLVAAQSWEILRRNNDEAAWRYEEVQNQTDDPLVRLQAFAGLARIHSEKNEISAALKQYEQIVHIIKHPVIARLDQQNISDALTGIVNIALEKQMSEAVLNIDDLEAMELLTFLGLPQKCLTESEYMLLYRKNKDRYNDGLRDYLDGECRNNCDSLFLKLDRERVKNSAFCNFYNGIERSLSTVGSNKRNTASHLPGTHDTLSVVFSSKVVKGMNLGLFLNISTIMHENFTVLDDTVSFPRGIAWRITDPTDRVFARSKDFNIGDETLSLYMNEFGNWKLEFHEVDHGSFGMLIEAGQVFYFLGFIFVIAAMAIGLLLAIRFLTADYRLSILKSDFVSTVSHEFKSPLTSIRMMSERLAEKRVKSEERKLEYYNSMLSQSEKLSHLVENILDFSRLDEGRKAFNFEPSNLTRIVGEAIEYLSIRNSESGFEISFKASDDQVFGIVDSQGMHQVVFNLIDNAIKYSGNSRKVEVMLESSDQTITISVRDFGIGIAKKEKSRIYNRFYRSDRVNIGGVKGSGIGLSIVHEIVKAHHGRIELESEVNKGSTFRVFIPVNQNKT